MSEVTLQERLEAAVEDLNRCHTGADVAEILRREKVTGRRGEACDCPLTNLLRKRLALAEDDSVEVNGVRYIVVTSYGSAELPMGSAAEAFITAFDSHSYDEFAVAGSKCDDEGCELCWGNDTPGGGSTEVTPNA